MKRWLGQLMRGPLAWVLAAIAVAAPILLGRWAYLGLTDAPQAVTEDGVMIAAGGMAVLTGVFVGLLSLARLALRQGGGLVGVARTVLDEAIHMKVAIVFIVLLLVMVPTLPFLMDASDPLRYRVQAFLSYSMMVTMLLLSLLTILLACWTLSGEIEQKQIFTIATKPISRTKFLLGKWLGIVTLNGILLAVASLGIWGYTMQYLAKQEPTEAYDGAALQQEVLTARVAQRAQAAEDIEELALRRLDRIQRDDPETLQRMGQEEAERRRLGNPGRDMIMDLGREAMFRQLVAEQEQQWRSVAPMGTASFVFEGLEHAHLYSDYLQFRYMARVSEEVPDGQLPVLVTINGEQVPLTIVTGQAQVVPIPTEVIGDDGRIEMVVYNRNPHNPEARRQITLVFDGGEGLEMLYRVGSFEPNFVRAMVANWVKLAFLAMLGLTAATFLGFPVASLLAVMVFVAAAGSPFLIESSAYYGGGEGIAGLLRGGLSGLGAGVATLLHSFAYYSPRTLIVSGRYFGWAEVAGCVMWLGVLWTGGIGLLAAFIFHRRELARVQV